MQNLSLHSAGFSSTMRYVERCISLLVWKKEGACGMNFGWLVGMESLVQFSDEYTKLNSLLAVEMPEVHTVCRKNACLWKCLSAFGLWEWLCSSLGRWLWSLAEHALSSQTFLYELPIFEWKHLLSQTCLAEIRWVCSCSSEAGLSTGLRNTSTLRLTSVKPLIQ